MASVACRLRSTGVTEMASARVNLGLRKFTAMGSLLYNYFSIVWKALWKHCVECALVGGDESVRAGSTNWWPPGQRQLSLFGLLKDFKIRRLHIKSQTCLGNSGLSTRSPQSKGPKIFWSPVDGHGVPSTHHTPGLTSLH